MLISSSKSDNQVNSGNRLNKKSPPDSSPVVSPALISKAAAIARRRVRLQTRLDYLTVANLVAFAYQINHTLSQLEHMPLHDGYVTGEHYGRTYHFTPANWFNTKTEYAIFRLLTYTIFTNPIYHSKLLMPSNKQQNGIRISAVNC